LTRCIKIYLRNEDMPDFDEKHLFAYSAEEDSLTLSLFKLQFSQGEILLDKESCYEGKERKGECDFERRDEKHGRDENKGRAFFSRKSSTKDRLAV